jgi:hypothetical protein
VQRVKRRRLQILGHGFPQQLAALRQNAEGATPLCPVT